MLKPFIPGSRRGGTTSTGSSEELRSPPSEEGPHRQSDKEFTEKELRAVQSIYVEPQCGRALLLALVDTGADGTVIRVSSVPASARPVPSTKGIQGLGGYVSSLGEVHLTFTIPGLDIQEAEVCIVPDDAISHPSCRPIT